MAQNSIKYNRDNYKNIFTKFYLFVEKNGTICKAPKKLKQKFESEPIQPIEKEDEYVVFYDEDYDLEQYNGPPIILIETEPAFIHKSYLKFLKRKTDYHKDDYLVDPELDLFKGDYDNF